MILFAQIIYIKPIIYGFYFYFIRYTYLIIKHTKIIHLDSIQDNYEEKYGHI